MISNMRRSLRQEEPREVSTLDTVPDPTMVPAQKERVLQMCVMMSRKEKYISGPDSTSPNTSPFKMVFMLRCNRPSFQKSSISSGVTTSENAVAGFELKNRNLLEFWNQVAKGDVVAEHHQAIYLSTSAPLVPIGISSSTTQISDSKSHPQSKFLRGMSCVGRRKTLEPPWYTRGHFKVSGGQHFSFAN